ncbi:hypothetical protein QTI93_14085 [Clostridium perfringens]|nr:hypothetical protein [Clostridium perfringens]
MSKKLFTSEEIKILSSKLQYQIELVLNYDLRTNQYNEYISSKCISNNSSGVL